MRVDSTSPFINICTCKVKTSWFIIFLLQEIEEKAPILKQQREDYENSLYNIDQLTKQLDSSLLVSTIEPPLE